MGESPQAPAGSRAPSRWFVGAMVLAVLAAPGWAWTTWGDPPLWVAAAAMTAIGLALVCVVVATILRSRTEGVSIARTLGRALWAPVRFFLDWTV